MQRRPRLVTWLAISVLTLATFSLAGFIAGFYLPDLEYAVPREYLLTRNALWALGSLLIGVGLLYSAKWAPRATRLSLLLIALWFLLDRVLLTQSASANRTLTLSIVLIVLGLGVAFWILNRPESQTYFRENQV